ncbi:MAG: asparagine synthase-related protein, partial [Archangium sp.]
SAPTFPWLAMAYMRNREGGNHPPYAPELLQRLDLPGYMAARYQEALAEVPHLEGETGQERRMREVFYLHLTRWLQMLLDRKDRMSMATALEVRVPFCDHRLVEYVFNTPWSMKTFDGREKSLLRAATEDVLPRSVVERRKSPYPSTQDPEYAKALRRQLTAVLDNKAAPVHALLDRNRARALVEDNPQGPSTQFSRLGLEQLLILNAWLTRYEVQLAL